EVTEDYRFEGPKGDVGLVDLFDGRSQLIVQHFMFDPSWDEGCPSCTAAADELSAGLLRHIHARDTSFAAVSRAPLEKIERYKSSKGWDFPWYSSNGSRFNYDYHVTIDASEAPVEWNFRAGDELDAAGFAWMRDGSSEQPGYSVFLHTGGRIFHTYSMYARGAEWLGGGYAFLDITPLGRQEDWEEPKGRAESVRGPNPNFGD
ncbi:MAG: hypothetical protein QOD30_196, partial [Actinomycetota bacterium]|nr:hypothetical protein [Actinomycetota bacterium]